MEEEKKELRSEFKSLSNIKVNEESSIKTPVCRICYDVEQENNLLLHPCRCSGSVRYVHEECLKTWLLSSEVDLNSRACELCHTTFLMEYKVETYITLRELCDETLGTCLFIPILLSILGLVIVIIYFLTVKYQSKDTKSDDKVYSLALIAGCSVAALIIIAILVYIVKSTVIKSRMEQWRIMNQDFPQEVVEKEAEEDHTLFTQGLESNSNNLLILPKKAKICGKKVKAPKIMPLSLFPVYEGQQMIGYKSEIKEAFVQSYAVKAYNNTSSKVLPYYIEKHNVTL